MQVGVGIIIPISLQLWDGDETQFPRAYLYNPDFTPYSTPYVDLSAQNNSGLYGNTSIVMPALGLLATFKVFTDAGRTIQSGDHTMVEETYEVGTGGSTVIQTTSCALTGEVQSSNQVVADIDENPVPLIASVDSLTLEAAATSQQDIVTGIVSTQEVAVVQSQNQTTGVVDC